MKYVSALIATVCLTAAAHAHDLPVQISLTDYQASCPSSDLVVTAFLGLSLAECAFKPNEWALVNGDTVVAIKTTDELITTLQAGCESAACTTSVTAKINERVALKAKNVSAANTRRNFATLRRELAARQSIGHINRDYTQ